MELLEYERIPTLVVRLGPNDEAVRWTAISNAPVLIYGEQPPRAGWAEILEFVERMQPDPPLVPRAAENREKSGYAMALSAGRIHKPSRSLLENRLQTISYAARQHHAASTH